MSAIELEQPPLSGCSLFTITGPTGAGKSTILDAMSLALFGTAPRLEDQGRAVKVGRHGEDEALRQFGDRLQLWQRRH